MARLSYLFLTALAALGANAASSVLDLIPDNFDKVVLESNKPALVEFFAPWCGHCKKLAPIYEELAQNFDFAKDKVSIAKVDADAEKTLGKRFGVQGFPTLKWFDGKSDKPEDYSGGRDLESLSGFITEKTGIKMKGKKAIPSAVEMLTDSSFKTEIGGDKDVLVAFTAPWCGRMAFHRQIFFEQTLTGLQTAKAWLQFGKPWLKTMPPNPTSSSPKSTLKPRTQKPQLNPKVLAHTPRSNTSPKAPPHQWPTKAVAQSKTSSPL